MGLPSLRSALASAFLLAAAVCGAEPTKVVFQLDWIHNVQFAGLHWAVEKGLFREAGIEVEIRPIVKNQETVAAVLAEPLPTFGSIESNVLLGARSRGAPVVAIGTMFQGSPMGWMSLEKAGITSVADLKGRRVGIHPDGDKVIDLALRRVGLTKGDVTLVTVGHDPAELIAGDVDVMQGYVIDEFVKLQLATGGTSRMLLAKDNGYVAYSQVVFTTEAVLAANPELARTVLRVLRQGWTEALANPEAAAELTISRFNPTLDRAYQVASLRSIGGLVSPDGLPPLSRMTLESWRRGQEIFLEAGVLAKPVDLARFVRLDLLPSEP